MKGILVGVIAALVLAVAPAHAGTLDTTTSTYEEMPKAARTYVNKLVKSIEAGKTKAFLALLPKKIEVHGEYDAFTFTFTKSQLKKAITHAGGLAKALSLSAGDWTLVEHDGSYDLYRGPDGPASATLQITKVKKAWRLTGAAVVDRVDYAARPEADRYQAYVPQAGEHATADGIFYYDMMPHEAVEQADGSILSSPRTDGKLISPEEWPGGTIAAKLGEVIVTEGLEVAMVRRYLKRKLSMLRYCYEKELLATPGLEGEVKFGVRVDVSGKVLQVMAVGVSAAVSQCVHDVLVSIEYPREKNGVQTGFHGKLSFYDYD